MTQNLDFLLKPEQKDYNAFTHGLFFDFQSRRVLRDYPTDKRDEKSDAVIIKHLTVAGLLYEGGITALGHHVREADKKYGPGPIPLEVAFSPWPVADLRPTHARGWAYLMLWGLASGRDQGAPSWFALWDYLTTRADAHVGPGAMLPATPDPVPVEKPKKTRSKKTAEPAPTVAEADDFSILDDDDDFSMLDAEPAPADDGFDDFI